MKALLYSEADSDRANHEWKASCGPHSIAAACGLTLDQVRPALTNYKGWMSPTQMLNALRTLNHFPGEIYNPLKTPKLCEGINRIQWEGKWLNPGVPPRVAYFHTHWVAHFGGMVLCTATDPATWVKEPDWRDFQVNALKSPFHVTHHYVMP